jgi:hypothetical protein
MKSGIKQDEQTTQCVSSKWHLSVIGQATCKLTSLFFSLPSLTIIGFCLPMWLKFKSPEVSGSEMPAATCQYGMS